MCIYDIYIIKIKLTLESYKSTFYAMMRKASEILFKKYIFFRTIRIINKIYFYIFYNKHQSFLLNLYKSPVFNIFFISMTISHETFYNIDIIKKYLTRANYTLL